MRAVVLAGGLGTRLHPYTTVLPKPLVPVGDRPILEHIVRQLAAAGVTRVDLCVSHLGELIGRRVVGECDAHLGFYSPTFRVRANRHPTKQRSCGMTAQNVSFTNYFHPAP